MNKATKRATLAVATGLSFLIMGASAHAGCVTKAAQATAASEGAAKWLALETMVQSVSWSLWPGFVATNTVAGYDVKGQRYKCSKDAGLVTCRGQATFCKK